MTRDVLSHAVVRFSQAPTIHVLLPMMTRAIWLLMASLRSSGRAQALIKGLVDDQVMTVALLCWSGALSRRGSCAIRT